VKAIVFINKKPKLSLASAVISLRDPVFCEAIAGSGSKNTGFYEAIAVFTS
jgi:hypothetical protein